MSQENVDLVRDGYDDFNSGNIEALTARFHPEIEWIEPGGGNAPSGTFNGPQSVGEDVFSVIPQNFDEFSAEPDNYDDQGDTIVVTGRFKGKAKNGQELDSGFEHVFGMKDGKVSQFENKVDQEPWTAAWS